MNKAIFWDSDGTLMYGMNPSCGPWTRHYNFPELVKVFERLGLDKYFSGYFLSADIGYEKPNREIFLCALANARKPEICYMVGDNPITDVKGAQAVGMKTILVHRKPEGAEPDYCCAELTEIKKVIVE